jgi:predicted nucleic acid-binding protein
VPSYFFDTSALLKLYHPEAGTRRVEAIFRHKETRLVVSRLAVVEMESAFSKKVRTGVISADERRRISAKFYLDLGSRITVIAMTEVHFSRARLLLLHDGSGIGLRTLDALQLAVASEPQERRSIDALVSSDTILAEVAQTQGLAVINLLTS